MCGDIELIIPCKTASELAEVRGHIAKQFGCTKSGTAKTSGMWGEIQFDIFPCHSYQLGSILLHATGSWAFNKEMRERARERGLKLNQYGLFKRKDDSPVVISNKEETFFKYLDMDYVDPCNRSLS
jgi:DNA polymerase (family 10)